MEKYEEAKIEIIRFDTEDVIATSILSLRGGNYIEMGEDELYSE